MAKTKSTKHLAALIAKAKGKKELANVQAIIAAELRINPFSLSSKDIPDWVVDLDDCDFEADASVVLYGSSKSKKKGGRFIPPPFLFESNAAFDYIKHIQPDTQVSVSFNQKKDRWFVETDTKKTAEHKYLAAALMQAILT